MNIFVKSAILCGALLGASHAQAAEWWYLVGAPNAPAARFVDADSVKRAGNRVDVTVVRVDRRGRSTWTLQRIDCRASSTHRASNDVREFICATSSERAERAMLLGSLTPAQASNAIFAASASAKLEY